MKKKLLSQIGLAVMVMLLLSECEPKSKWSFSGIIVDQEGNGIENAMVEVGEKSAKSDAKGNFLIRVKPTGRYVLNVTKLGFGFVSKIYQDTLSNIVITMSTATVEEIEEEVEVIQIEDTTPPPPESAPLSSNINTVFSPIDTIAFVYNGKGRLIGFGAPPEVADTYAAAEDFEAPQVGASVEVEADALEEESTTEASFVFFQNSKKGKGKITASISTVDLYSSDGMPGDYTIGEGGENAGYMETFGAADVNFYRNGESLQLRKGQYATLTIPVDTLALLALGKKMEKRSSIPLFVYDKKEGIWQKDKDKWTGKESRGILNKKGTAYVAKISHFSVYNMDEEFSTPSCTRIVNDATGPGNIPTTAQIEVAVPPHINNYPVGSGCNDVCGLGTGFNIHAIARMKENQPIGMRIFDATGNIKSTYVLIGGTSSPDVYSAACGDPEYCSCNTALTIKYDTEPYMNPDGSMNKPIIAAQPVGTDINISWLYVPEIVAGSPPDYTTVTPREYTIEWSLDDFISLEGSVTMSTLSTDWHNTYVLPKSVIDASTSDGASAHKIRIREGSTLAPTYSDAANECYTPDTDGFGSC